MSNLLIVDDDTGVLGAFENLLGGMGHRVSTAMSGEAALEFLKKHRPDLIIMDVRMPGISGLETIQRIKKIDVKLPVIIMTGHATAETAIEATKFGAFDYHLKPLDPEPMLQSIEQALKSAMLMTRTVELDPGPIDSGADAIVGQTRGMQDVFKSIGRVAATDAAVLIRGETGTGKELVARAVYQHSGRARAPLVVVNCAAIPEALLESEFFGHEKGSFTGADKRRVGKFEQAAGGTIFLDEIGDMPLSLQAKLLRVLQNKTIERIGSDGHIPIDVRVIAATHHDLERDVAAGKFREDLYHRLAVFAITLPPLRERRDDIPHLAAFFIRRFAAELGIELPRLTQDGLDALRGHDWPGNVRELQHCIQRAMITQRGLPISGDEIRKAVALVSMKSASANAGMTGKRFQELAAEHLSASDFPASQTAGAIPPYDSFLAAAEKSLLTEAMKLAGGNQTHAAKILGIPRPTLKSRLDRHGL